MEFKVWAFLDVLGVWIVQNGIGRTTLSCYKGLWFGRAKDQSLGWRLFALWTYGFGLFNLDYQGL